jgi:hypothetical protein
MNTPEPKYKIDQEVWFLGVANQLCNDEITHIDMGIQNHIYFLSNYEGLFHESIVYPTKAALIEAQIEYWQSQRETNLKHFLPEVFITLPLHLRS